MCYVTASRNPDTQMGKGHSVSHVTRLHNMGQTSHWELEKMDTECKVNLLESIGKLITLTGPQSWRRRDPREASPSLGTTFNQFAKRQLGSREVEQCRCQAHRDKQTNAQRSPNQGPPRNLPLLALVWDLKRLSFGRQRENKGIYVKKHNWEKLSTADPNWNKVYDIKKIILDGSLVPQGGRKHK